MNNNETIEEVDTVNAETKAKSKPIQTTKTESEVIDTSPKKKIIDLLNAFAQAGDDDFLNLVKTESTKYQEILSLESKDDELISALRNFRSLIEQKNSQVVDLSLFFYQTLKGENKIEMGKILSHTLDYNVTDLAKINYEKYKEPSCAYAVNTFYDLTGKDELNFLDSRINKVKSVLDTSNGVINALEQTYIEKCIDVLKAKLNINPNVIITPKSEPIFEKEQDDTSL
ncbi:MAG: hypothetical protein U0T83_00430 [Bacteriovoracaceae bacterium]